MNEKLKKLSWITVLFVTAIGIVSAEWELVWSDEFETEGELDTTKWRYQLGGGGWGNGELQNYTQMPENVRVEDGKLIIEAQQASGGRTPSYTSARVRTHGLHSWQYGRFEIRAKVPKTTGTWSAIWMLSEDGLLADAYWPDNGEIDIMEHVGYAEDPLYHAIEGNVPKNIHSTLHTAERNHLTSSGIQGSVYVETATSEFHEYALNWFEDRMEFFVDGVLYSTIKKADQIPRRNPPDDIAPYWPFDQPFHLIMNVAVGGSWGGAFNNEWVPGSPYGTSGVDHDGEWPQRMEIEYVRVYEYSGTEPVEFEDSPIGPLYTGNAPWLYSSRLGSYLYTADGQWDFADGGQWLYIPRRPE